MKTGSVCLEKLDDKLFLMNFFGSEEIIDTYFSYYLFIFHAYLAPIFIFLKY